MEVVGFPNLTGPSPVLQEALARRISVAPLRDAHPLDADNLFRAANDATRVSVDAVLLNMSADLQTLELQTGLRRSKARLDGDDKFVATQPASTKEGQLPGIDAPPGSRLKLTGIYAGQGK